MKNNRLTIYSKVCLPCVLKDEWQKFRRAALEAGYELDVARTTYDSKLHDEASKLWGSDSYTAFIIAPNGEALNINEAKKMFEDIKDKLVKAGKTKPVRKGKKHVQGLRKTKRSIRVDSVEDSPVEVKVENKTR